MQSTFTQDWLTEVLLNANIDLRDNPYSNIRQPMDRDLAKRVARVVADAIVELERTTPGHTGQKHQES